MEKTYQICRQRLKLVKEEVHIYSAKITSSRVSNDAARSMWDMDNINYLESFYVLYLDNANMPISWNLISIGATSACLADMKVIMSNALLCGASSMICFHNHPSGEMRPSNADVQLTKKLKEGAKLLDITLLDHIIVHPENEYKYYSFADEGKL